MADDLTDEQVDRIAELLWKDIATSVLLPLEYRLDEELDFRTSEGAGPGEELYDLLHDDRAYLDDLLNEEECE